MADLSSITDILYGPLPEVSPQERGREREGEGKREGGEREG